MTPLQWLLVGAGALLLSLLFVLERSRRRARAEAPRPVRVAVRQRRPVPPAPADALDALPLPIRACPECGSAGMRPLAMGEGGVPGVSELLDRQLCPRCGHEGLAVAFDRHEDYASFLRRLDLAWRARERKGA